jgi:hypothetical protein
MSQSVDFLRDAVIDAIVPVVPEINADDILDSLDDLRDESDGIQLAHNVPRRQLLFLGEFYRRRI